MDRNRGRRQRHIVLEGDDVFSLWFGKAKFFNSIEDARLPAIFKSVGNSLDTAKLKKENSIITNASDVEYIDGVMAVTLNRQKQFGG